MHVKQFTRRYYPQFHQIFTFFAFILYICIFNGSIVYILYIHVYSYIYIICTYLCIYVYINMYKCTLYSICTVHCTYITYILQYKSRFGQAFFSKEHNILAFFPILYKRTERFLHSFPFLIKEQNDLCILSRSL